MKSWHVQLGRHGSMGSLTLLSEYIGRDRGQHRRLTRRLMRGREYDEPFAVRIWLHHSKRSATRLSIGDGVDETGGADMVVGERRRKSNCGG